MPDGLKTAAPDIPGFGAWEVDDIGFGPAEDNSKTCEEYANKS